MTTVTSKSKAKAKRTSWLPVIHRAREIVSSYTTPVTLRQLYYRLVSEELIPNKRSAYSRLSELTAKERRDGTFPDLMDRTRKIHRPVSFDSPRDALIFGAKLFRLDRTRGQDVSIYLGVEKAGMINQLDEWFSHSHGFPVLPLGGYASQTHKDRTVRDAQRSDRPAVLIYAGDFDPSGEDIDRDFVARTDCWSKVIRVALNVDQLRDYNLPPQMGKATDSRAAGFIEKYGQLVQVELDALDPDDLHQLFADAIESFWDVSVFEAVKEREDEMRAELAEFLDLDAWD